MNQGSVFHFTVTFDVSKSAPQIVQTTIPPILIGARALVVDDNATNRHVLGSMLAELGLHPQMADTSEVAHILLSESIATSQPYGLLLLDAHMPGLDAQSIAEDPRFRESRVIILTTPLSDGNKITPEQGVYVTKPVIEPELVHALAVQQIPRFVPQPKSTTQTDPQRTRPDVLLAEDNVVHLFILFIYRFIDLFIDLFIHSLFIYLWIYRVIDL